MSETPNDLPQEQLETAQSEALAPEMLKLAEYYWLEELWAWFIEEAEKMTGLRRIDLEGLAKQISENDYPNCVEDWDMITLHSWADGRVYSFNKYWQIVNWKWECKVIDVKNQQGYLRDWQEWDSPEDIAFVPKDIYEGNYDYNAEDGDIVENEKNLIDLQSETLKTLWLESTSILTYDYVSRSFKLNLSQDFYEKTWISENEDIVIKNLNPLLWNSVLWEGDDYLSDGIIDNLDGIIIEQNWVEFRPFSDMENEDILRHIIWK